MSIIIQFRSYCCHCLTVSQDHTEVFQIFYWLKIVVIFMSEVCLSLNIYTNCNVIMSHSVFTFCPNSNNWTSFRVTSFCSCVRPTDRLMLDVQRLMQFSNDLKVLLSNLCNDGKNLHHHFLLLCQVSCCLPCRYQFQIPDIATDSVAGLISLPCQGRMSRVIRTWSEQIPGTGHWQTRAGVRKPEKQYPDC